MSLDDLPFPPSHATVGLSQFAIPLGYIRTHKPTLPADKCRTRTQLYIRRDRGKGGTSGYFKVRPLTYREARYFCFPIIGRRTSVDSCLRIAI